MNDRPQGHAADHSDDEVDRRFEELVADWHERTSEPLDRDDPEPPAPEPAPFVVPAQWRAGTGPSIVEDHEDEFVPPEPEPLPHDEGFWLTLGCLVGGPVWLLYLFFFDRYAASLWWVLAIAMFVAGIVLLVMRQPASREDDDPFDDGARL